MTLHFNTYFTTATLLHWAPLLEEDLFKDFIIEALRFQVVQRRVNILAFVIMETHFHVVWEIIDPNTISKIQHSVLTFTANRMLKTLKARRDYTTLKAFKVERPDRDYQLWQDHTLSIEIITPGVLRQKINYVHSNRMKKGESDVNYKYSSASFYAGQGKNWDFL